MSAWGTQFNTKGKIRMLADPSAAFTKAVDLSLELAPLGELLGENLIKCVKITNLFSF
jgi:peroxiredoxin 5